MSKTVVSIIKQVEFLYPVTYVNVSKTEKWSRNVKTINCPQDLLNATEVLWFSDIF